MGAEGCRDPTGTSYPDPVRMAHPGLTQSSCVMTKFLQLFPLMGQQEGASDGRLVYVEFHFLQFFVQHSAYSLVGLTQRRYIQALLRIVSVGLPEEGAWAPSLEGKAALHSILGGLDIRKGQESSRRSDGRW